MNVASTYLQGCKTISFILESGQLSGETFEFNAAVGKLIKLSQKIYGAQNLQNVKEMLLSINIIHVKTTFEWYETLFFDFCLIIPPEAPFYWK